MCSEVIDAMFQPSRYDSVYPYSYLYTYFVTVPHSFMTQLAYPTANAKYSKFCSLHSSKNPALPVSHGPILAGTCSPVQLDLHHN